MAGKMVAADWYFDLISPFAYLQFKGFGRLPADLAITPKPVLFGAILKHWGQLGPAEIAPKRIHTYRMCQWLADNRGIPFRMPPRHPFNPLKALRLLVATGPTFETVNAGFDFIFRDGRAPDTPEEFAAFADAIGVKGESADDADAKTRLRKNTGEAIGRQVFGVPTFNVDGKNFWGEDATAMLVEWLEDRTLFERPAMQWIDTVQVGVVRDR